MEINKKYLWLILFFIFVLAFAGLFGRDLWTPDEPREAAISLEMATEHNFLLPKLAGKAFVEKPLLFYIFGAITIKFFGEPLGNTAALKLIPLFCGIFTLFLTSLIAKTFLGPRCAFLAAAILAAMPGFIHITHWLLIDNLLLFFVTLSFYLLTQSYIKNKWQLLPITALAIGMAFWTKGVIALIFVFLGWLGIIANKIITGGWKKWLTPTIVIWHAIALLIAIIGITSWPALLYKLYGKELFNEWFWQNHFGRFAGTSKNLGHINNNPLYYIGFVAIYFLPFLPYLLAGLRSLLKQKLQEYSAIDFIFICSGIGGFILLSISSTKREIYFAPLLPIYAIFLAYTIDKLSSNFFNLWLVCWNICLGMMLILLIPLTFLFGNKAMLGITLIAVTLYLCWLIVSKKQTDLLVIEKFLLNWTGVLIVVLLISTSLLDKYKNYSSHFIDFAQQIKDKENTFIWRPDETTKAGFYYYSGLVFPELRKIEELKTLLSNPSSYVIALNRSFPPKDSGSELPNWENIYERQFGFGKNPRKLILIKGKGISSESK